MSLRRMPPASAQRGISLLELMIAMALGLIVVLGVTRVFISSKQGYRIQESTGRLQENARFAMDVLAREIRHADFWGGIDGNAINRHSSLTATTACSEAWMADARVGIQAWAGAATSPLGACTVSNYVPNTDVLAVRYAEPTQYVRTAFFSEATNDDGQRNGRLFLRARIGRDGLIFPWSEREEGLQGFPGDETSGVFSYRLGGRVLFARRNAQGRPSLYVRQLDSGGVSTSIEWIEGIEMMRFQFGIDEDGDGAVNRYLATSDMDSADWDRARSVRIGLVVRGDLLDGFSDEATYTLPDGYAFTPAAADRGFQRRLFVQDVQIRNRLGGS